jgi:1-acyl-sn-glycerol-3-phosphate acyltransferase
MRNAAADFDCAVVAAWPPVCRQLESYAMVSLLRAACQKAPVAQRIRALTLDQRVWDTVHFHASSIGCERMITLRSALFNLIFFLVTFVLTMAATVVRWVAPQHVLGMAMLWARVMVACAHSICGIRVEVTGLERIPGGAALIASRHQSAFDTFVWMTLLPRCCYVLKQELLRIPLFGKLIIGSRMIAIDRTAGSAALRALLREGDRAVREARQIVIFPEGTRSEPGNVRELQTGVAALAVRTKLPIIPVATDSGQCWGRRAFHKRPGVIRIVVGEPIPPTLRRHELMLSLRATIGALDEAPAPTGRGKSA